MPCPRRPTLAAIGPCSSFGSTLIRLANAEYVFEINDADSLSAKTKLIPFFLGLPLLLPSRSLSIPLPSPPPPHPLSRLDDPRSLDRVRIAPSRLSSFPPRIFAPIPIP
eukprot:9502292-Pyramimonas_sp.AAC.1